MASLMEQMELLKIKQEILSEKIRNEEKRKETFTLNQLENLNNMQKHSINTYSSPNTGIWKQTNHQIRLNTLPRFEIILEILKKQDARIAQLEAIIENKNNEMYKKLMNEAEHSRLDYELPINR